MRPPDSEKAGLEEAPMDLIIRAPMVDIPAYAVGLILLRLLRLKKCHSFRFLCSLFLTPSSPAPPSRSMLHPSFSIFLFCNALSTINILFGFLSVFCSDRLRLNTDGDESYSTRAPRVTQLSWRPRCVDLRFFSSSLLLLVLIFIFLMNKSPTLLRIMMSIQLLGVKRWLTTFFL